MSAERRPFVNRARRVAWLAAGLLAAASPAIAQTAQGSQAPEHYTLDERGVDTIRGTFNLSVTDLAIGPQDGGMQYTRIKAGEVYRSNFDGLIEVELSGEIAPGQYQWTYTVSLGGTKQSFSTVYGGSMTSLGGDGATLDYDGFVYIHTDRDGVVRLFDPALADPYTPPIGTPPNGPGGRITRLTKPTGEHWDWHYRSASWGSAPAVRRVQSVTSTRGYQMKFAYAFNGTPGSQAELDAFGRLSQAIGINTAVDYCDPTADICAGLSQTWPNATYGVTTGPSTTRLDVTNALSQTTGYVFAGPMVGGNLLEIDWPEPGRASTTLAYGSFPFERDPVRVTQYSDGRGSWTYDYAQSGSNNGAVVTTVTDPNSQQTQYRARLFVLLPGGNVVEQQRLLWFQNGFGSSQRTYTEYDSKGRLTQITHPEGNIDRWTYDGRGNILETRRITKPSAPAADIVSAAAFPSTCANPRTCNQPTSRTDPRGAVTDYAYDPFHGGLLSETRPAGGNGVRPQTRYSYGQGSAWYRTSTSPNRTAGPPIWLPTGTSACANTAVSPGCSGTADEVRTLIFYQPGSASAGANFLPVTAIAKSGDGALEATTTTTWTDRGDPLTVDGPLPGTADTTFSVYDALRRVVGVIGPDPDGGGPLGFPAARTTYNADGQPTSVEQGTTTGQSVAAFAAFTSLQTATTAYDAQGRKAWDTTAPGTAAAMVTQYAYDNEGRTLCTAQRMNPAAFGALPASACDLGTAGSFGPDRISRNSYDAADRLTVVESAVGTPLAQATQTQSWTPNGQVDWIEDANGNRSDYAYDGFDRPVRLSFPSATTGAHAANPADYEEYSYDAGSNPVSKRVRSGEVFTTTFDALNRITLVDAPAGTQDTAFTYDLLDRRLTASQPGVQTVTSTWDALGRNTSETGPLGTVGQQYDLAGRRTRITWPSGHWADYVRRVDGALGSVLLDGYYPAASYAYDDLSRRTAFTRGGGVTSSSYAYDAASRLTSLTHDLAGTSHDVSYGLDYSPAGQVVDRTVSNPAYDYTPVAVSQAYVPDGLNQYNAVGGVTLTHDLRGNLTSDGVRTYGYDAANRLRSGGGASLTYDPLDRLYESTGTGSARYQYAGTQMIRTHGTNGDAPTSLVPGDGPDEWILTDWDGAGLFAFQDPLGSVVALTDWSGSVWSINAYDEYGQPRPGNLGRMQYTGQLWLPDLALSHYKARGYRAGLGRFVQTDPVGYEQGLNLYAYVGNDPINATDPTGMFLDSEFGDYEIGGAIFEAEPSQSSGGRRSRGTRNRSARQEAYAAGEEHLLRQILELNPSYSTLSSPNAQPSLSRIRMLERELTRLQGLARDFPHTVQDVYANPQLLSGRLPQDVAPSLIQSSGWRVETLRRGSAQGRGWVLREYGQNGLPTDRLIRWHPGGGHHGDQPYWRVRSGQINFGPIY